MADLLASKPATQMAKPESGGEAKRGEDFIEIRREVRCQNLKEKLRSVRGKGEVIGNAQNWVLKAGGWRGKGVVYKTCRERVPVGAKFVRGETMEDVEGVKRSFPY